MQTINDKHTWFMIYEDIIRDSLINAKRYERYDKTRELNASMRSMKMTSSLTASMMEMSTYSARYSLRMKRKKRT